MSNQELFSQGGAGLVEGFRMTAFGEYADDDKGSALKARDYKDATDLVVQPMAYDRYNDSLHEIAPTVQAANTGRVNGVVQPMAFNVTFCDANGRRKDRPNGGLYVSEAETTNTLTQAPLPTLVVPQMAVRRLLPTECEALQGFPRGYTAIPWKNKPADQCPDGPRYKALGNSMAVPVMQWIGERIQAVEDMMKELGR